jgi:CheY-like chemotaxis protein
MPGMLQAEGPQMIEDRRLIAIIDDDKTIIELLDDFLKEEGYTTLCAYSGKEAYRIIKKEQPDLIILDMQMEQRDTGLQVLELVRLDPTTAEIPVLMCSADGQFLREKEQQLRAHKCDTLEKPYNLDEILNRLKTLLGSPSHSANGNRRTTQDNGNIGQ